MGIVQVETVVGVSNGANPGVMVATLGTPTVTGELIVVLASTSGNGATFGSETDSASQTYTKIWEVTGLQGGHRSLGLWYKEGSVSGVTTVTFTAQSGDPQGAIIVGHYTGIAPSGSLDQNGGTPTGSTSPWSSASVTTTQADELLIGGCYGLYNSGAAVTISPSGSWIQDQFQADSANFDGGNGNGMAFAHQIVAATGSYANTGTSTSTGASGNFAGIATFKAAGSVAGAPISPPRQSIPFMSNQRI